MLQNIKSLESYIKDNYNNKPVSFALTTTKTPQHIRKQVACGNFIVVGDCVCQIKYKTISKVRSKFTLAEKAVRDCKLIYRDLSERDALKMPYSVLDAWRTGRLLTNDNSNG